MPGKKDLIFIHPKLSFAVAEKIGAKSVQKTMISSNADMITFEPFGQSESLTRRLKNIIDMYPQGTQQLSELVQNADNARATVVKFVISEKQHGNLSLLGLKMGAWQGLALLYYNDSTFTEWDFQNLSRIGQASKLEKLGTI